MRPPLMNGCPETPPDTIHRRPSITASLHLVCHRPARGERILLITNRTDLKQVLAVYSAGH